MIKFSEAVVLQKGNAVAGYRRVDYNRSIVSAILGQSNRITCGPVSLTSLGGAIAIQRDPTSITNKASSETVDDVCPIAERSEGIEN